MMADNVKSFTLSNSRQQCARAEVAVGNPEIVSVDELKDLREESGRS